MSNTDKRTPDPASASLSSPLKNTEELDKKVLEIIKGFEPVGHLDGSPEKNVIPNGYDLDKDDRTEFGFYWEYEDMEECATKITALIVSLTNEVIGEDDKPFSDIDELDTDTYRNILRVEQRQRLQALTKGGI